MKRRLSLVVIAALVFGQARPAVAYLKFGVPVKGQSVTLRWAQTPRYFVSDSGVPGVSAADFQGAVGRAFATWQAVPTASITYQLAGVTSTRHILLDGRRLTLSGPDFSPDAPRFHRIIWRRVETSR